jgi:peroxiredoxin
MNRILMNALVLIVCGLLWIVPAQAAKSPPKVGDTLPGFSMAVPGESDARNYLGLSRGGSFKVPQVKAQVVILEVFSMYCPFCQKEAPNVNRLYQLIEENPNLRGKIKLIGIGAGNSSYEVNVFKTRYGIPFPLFPDMEYSIHALLGSVRTPYFIAARINSDGTHQVIYSKLGAFESAESFLRLIIKSAGL